MYEEFILILLFIFIIYYLLAGTDNRIDYLADNGETYKVRPSSDILMKEKANLLAGMNIKTVQLINDLYKQQLPNSQISNITYQRCENIKINECPDGSAGYTINKGQIICVCCEKNGKIVDETEAFFVVLHELAHVMSNEYGHGEEFQKNFDFITKFAVKNNLWKQKDYSKDNTDICGVNVTSGPCDNGACSKNSLEKYFNESLLDN